MWTNGQIAPYFYTSRSKKVHMVHEFRRKDLGVDIWTVCGHQVDGRWNRVRDIWGLVRCKACDKELRIFRPWFGVGDES